MAGYTRNDTGNNITNGNIINADDLDGEFDAIQSAFNSSTGHTHDGANNGAPITKVGPAQEIVVTASTVTPKTDDTVDLGSASLEFKDLYIDGVANIDSLIADTADINGGTIDGTTIGATTPSTGVFSQVNFGDNAKAIFGAGSDLQIYHNTALPGSVIEDVGSGDLIIKASNQIRFQDGSSNHYAIFNEGTSVDLYYNNAVKLATTSTGIDVTGTVVADGLTVDGVSEFINQDTTAVASIAALTPVTNSEFQFYNSDNAAAYTAIRFRTRSTGASSWVVANEWTASYKGDLAFYSRDGASSITQKMRLSNNGNISFYEDTGTTPKFFWDASAESLGIGTSSPAVPLHVNNASSSACRIYLQNTGNTAAGYTQIWSQNNDLVFRAGNIDGLRLDSAGNLGLGVTPSAWTLSGASAMQIKNAGWMGYLNNSYFTANASNAAGTWKYIASAAATLYEQNGGTHAWNTAASGTAGDTITFTQALTLTASGNECLGTTSENVVGRTQARLNVAAGSYDTVQLKGVSTSYLNIASWIPISGTAAYHIGFGDGTSSYTERGVISTNGSGTTYGTASDYRLKNNPQPLTNSGSFIDALQPKTWTWKENGQIGVGFIAHEVQEISPTSVIGEKDGERMQAMEYGSAEFIANIVAELQSLRQRVAQLEQA